jgi:flagellar hook assembly protein FlgD
VALDLELAAGVSAEVAVYGVDGRPVRRLATAAAGEGAIHRLDWDGRDDEGRPLPAGIYLVTATAGSLKASQKVVLVP